MHVTSFWHNLTPYSALVMICFVNEQAKKLNLEQIVEDLQQNTVQREKSMNTALPNNITLCTRYLVNKK